MKSIDQMFGLDPSLATPENPHYERFKTKLGWLAVGVTALTAGIITASAGAEVGNSVAFGGAVTMVLGGTAMFELPHLLSPDEDDWQD